MQVELGGVEQQLFAVERSREVAAHVVAVEPFVVHGAIVAPERRPVPGGIEWTGPGVLEFTSRVDDLTRLALRAGDGDREALAAFVRASQAEVWRLCAHLVDRNAADDLTQEVYLRAVPALARFRGDSSARTWLLSIARRTCADALRRRVRQRRLVERLQATTPADELAEPAEEGGDQEIDRLLGTLELDRRNAFVLTQLLGMSYAEAAEVCGVPVGTIRSRVARARADLLGVVQRGEGDSAAN